ncbi:DUF397 domain-containing protein [Streptomyces fradiae]|uniref:DUF397 domain-containing protein n=1 Tax=Streptomyces fradiae TaxID=1906 RepID=UPI0036B58A10
MSEPAITDRGASPRWRKSSYSGPEGGSCVEVLDGHPTGVPVRDSKTPQGPTLHFPAGPWSSFITSLKNRDAPSP